MRTAVAPPKLATLACTPGMAAVSRCWSAGGGLQALQSHERDDLPAICRTVNAMPSSAINAMPSSAALPVNGQVVQTGAALSLSGARAVVGASQAATSGSQALQAPPVSGRHMQAPTAGSAVPQAAGVFGSQHRLLPVNAVAGSDGSCTSTQHGTVPPAGGAAAEAAPSVGETAMPLAALVAESSGAAAAPVPDGALQQSRQDVGSGVGQQISLCRPASVPASTAGQQQSAVAPDLAPGFRQQYSLSGPDGAGPALGRYGQQREQLPAQELHQQSMQGSAQPGVSAAWPGQGSIAQGQRPAQGVSHPGVAAPWAEQGNSVQKQHSAQGDGQPGTAASVGRGIGVAWDAISSKWLAYLNFGGKQVRQAVVGHHLGHNQLPSEPPSQSDNQRGAAHQATVWLHEVTRVLSSLLQLEACLPQQWHMLLGACLAGATRSTVLQVELLRQSESRGPLETRRLHCMPIPALLLELPGCRICMSWGSCHGHHANPLTRS